MTDTMNHAALTGWAIDTSTGTPILTYEACSVIQDDQAHLVMRALTSLDALTREAEEQRQRAEKAEKWCQDAALGLGESRSNRISELEGKVEDLQKIITDGEEELASVLPEDYGVVEYIQHLEATIAAQSERIAKLEAVMEDCDAFLTVMPQTLNATPTGRYWQGLLIQVRAALAPKEAQG